MTSVPGHSKSNLQRSLRDQRPTYIQVLFPLRAWGADELGDWCRETYAWIGDGVVEMLLLRGSPSVRWDLIKR